MQKSMNICLGKGNMNTDGYGERLGETWIKNKNDMDTGICSQE